MPGKLSVEKQTNATKPALLDNPARGVLHRLAIVLIAAVVIAAALAAGLKLRVLAWESSGDPKTYMRLNFDIENGYHWGSQVMRDATALAADDRGARATDFKYWWPAFVHLYDGVEHGAIATDDGVQYQLDYTPARLFTMALWVRHMRLTYPHITVWLPQYQYTAPLLWLNNTCEMLGCLGAFFLVRFWVKRGQAAQLNAGGATAPLTQWQRESGWVLGLLAAIMIWFNPAMICDAHVWPQWEVWIIPAYLFGLYFASKDWWMLAGMIVAAGAQMKGQITMVAAVFILWPLFERRLGAALRFVIGAALAVAVVLSPWFLAGAPAVAYVLGVAIAGTVILAFCYGRKPSNSWWAIAPLVAAAVLWPWLLAAIHVAHGDAIANSPRALWGSVALLGIAGAMAVLLPGSYARWPARWRRPALVSGLLALAGCGLWLHRLRAPLPGAPAVVGLMAMALLLPRALPRRARWYWLAGVAAAAVFLAAGPFHASFAWYRISYEYPTRHWQTLSAGASNLGAILGGTPYGWSLHDHVWDRHAWTLPGLGWHVALAAIELRTFMGVLFVATLALCALGMARKNRRHDPAILIAFTTPWLLMFALMPQMHERYLVWAAVFSMLAVGASLGMTLLSLLLTAISFWLTLQTLFNIHPTSWPGPRHLTAGIFSGMSWVVLLCAAIYLYQTIHNSAGWNRKIARSIVH
ncbi:MAG TPA: hypothetical protein VFC78_20505 [Tepidisphaeraceae bacterium]|nr:hypothetical protein [Tepidisphaeraceae bacterium]